MTTSSFLKSIFEYSVGFMVFFVRTNVTFRDARESLSFMGAFSSDVVIVDCVFMENGKIVSVCAKRVKFLHNQ